MEAIAWQQRNAIIVLLGLIAFLLIRGNEIKVRVESNGTEGDIEAREAGHQSAPTPDKKTILFKYG
jgi:hypothetical protein